ncbi:MAG: hypothetical protein R3255_07400 [Candidatus Lokiarchaeia archaeon]|nr:hypothetical protein [Candidatus Lokiarchaeia archaeon]
MSYLIFAMIELVAPAISSSFPLAITSSIRKRSGLAAITGDKIAMIVMKNDAAISVLVSFNFFFTTIFTSNIFFYQIFFFNF